MIPIPHSYEALARQNKHPGLALDKFVNYTNVPTKDLFGNVNAGFSEHVQKAAVGTVAAMQPPCSAAEFNDLRSRRELMLSALGATNHLVASTAGPLTLHLARASALENAGLCLHPIYGFVYLPGSGLKGMARAYAETVWLPAQANKKQAWQQIENVFGWAPNSERGQQIMDPDHPAERRRLDVSDPNSPEIRAHVGNIIFHDAWPTAWPSLVEDILNSHHTKYYSAKDSAVPVPGDWEEPNMVSFLAVAAGVTFDFPLACRRNDVDPKCLEAARRWLLGGLTVLGPGAKTASGYGHFIPAKECVHLLPKSPGETYTLELVTPAFLAGAKQQADDCELRPSTLRGLLRWWWRTMHAGFLDVQTLRALEGAIWGSTKAGGPVRITLRRSQDCVKTPVPGKRVDQNRNGIDVLRPDPKFLVSHKLEKAPVKSTQGVLYLSYGMDEMPAGRVAERKQRICMLPGATWEIAITARPGYYHRPGAKENEKPVVIPVNIIRDQARAALCLLCQFGGVGSKGRNGFGSLVTNLALTLDNIKESGRAIRDELKLKLPEGGKPSPEISSLDSMLSTELITTGSDDYWFALDQLGFSLQAFCQGRKRNWVKEALGLPRKIGVSKDDGTVQHKFTKTWDRQTKQDVVWLGQKHSHRGKREAKDMRHARPIHCHFAREADGTYSFQVVAFPSNFPDAATSSSVLTALIAHLDPGFVGGSGTGSSLIAPTAAKSGPTPPAASPQAKPINKNQSRIGTLKKKDNGWVAWFEDVRREGRINDWKKLLATAVDGAKAEFFILEANKSSFTARLDKILP